jgi:hypothetical protein
MFSVTDFEMLDIAQSMVMVALYTGFAINTKKLYKDSGKSSLSVKSTKINCK